jgi:hypothetical protein
MMSLSCHKSLQASGKIVGSYFLRRTALGDFTVVLGGTKVTDNNAASIAPQPPFP